MHHVIIMTDQQPAGRQACLTAGLPEIAASLPRSSCLLAGR